MSYKNYSNILVVNDTGSLISRSRHDASFIYVKNRGLYSWGTGSADAVYNFPSLTSGSWEYIHEDIKIASFTINSGSLLRFLTGSQYFGYSFKELVITNLSSLNSFIKWDVSDNDYESYYTNGDTVNFNGEGGLTTGDSSFEPLATKRVRFENPYSTPRNRMYISSSRPTRIDVVFKKNEFPTDRNNTYSIQSSNGKYIFIDNTQYRGFNTSSGNYNLADGGFTFLSNGKSHNDVKRGELVLIKKDFNLTASLKAGDTPWGANTIYPEARALKLMVGMRFQPSSSKITYNVEGSNFFPNTAQETALRIYSYSNITGSFRINSGKSLATAISAHLIDLDLNLNCSNVMQEFDGWYTAYNSGLFQVGGTSGSYADTYIAFGAQAPRVTDNEAPGIAPVRNAYGLYIEDMKKFAIATGSGVTNAWGVYQLGRFTRNRFEGDVILAYLTGSGNRVLTIDNSGSISAASFSPDFANLTASNGLTNNSGALELGGRLTKNTTINGTSSLYAIDIKDNGNKQFILNIDTQDPNSISSNWFYYQNIPSPANIINNGITITSSSLKLQATQNPFALFSHDITITSGSILISQSGFNNINLRIPNLSSSVTTNEDFIVVDTTGLVSKTTKIHASKITGSYQNTSVKTVSSNYTLLPDDDIVYVNTSASNVIITIHPTGSVNMQYIKKITEDNLVILSGSAGALIEFEVTASLIYRGEVARIHRSGSNIYLL